MAEKTLKGSCLCRGFQFEVSEQPETVFICYCAHCVKNAGGPGQVVSSEHPLSYTYDGLLFTDTEQSARYKKDQVVVTRGSDLATTYVLQDTISGSDKHKVFCSVCGCTLWTVPMKHNGEKLIVRTSLIQDG